MSTIRSCLMRLPALIHHQNRLAKNTALMSVRCMATESRSDTNKGDAKRAAEQTPKVAKSEHESLKVIPKESGKSAGGSTHSFGKSAGDGTKPMPKAESSSSTSAKSTSSAPRSTSGGGSAKKITWDDYKVPEYHQHQLYTFYDLEADMVASRLPQPSSSQPEAKK